MKREQFTNKPADKWRKKGLDLEYLPTSQQTEEGDKEDFQSYDILERRIKHFEELFNTQSNGKCYLGLTNVRQQICKYYHHKIWEK